MSVVEDQLKLVGASGVPLTLDQSLANTWNVYHRTESPEDGFERILNVLGFYYLVRQSGLKRHINGKSDPNLIYQAIRIEQFDENVKELARKLAAYRLFDVLRVYSSKYNILMPIRGDVRTLRFDMCLVPKRNEHLDGTLAKLSGLLYNGDLPMQLQEKWRKLPVKSNAKPKSSLPKYTSLVGNDSILGWLPLFLSKDSGIAIYTRRATDDMLLLRFTVKVTAKPVPWMSDRKHNELLKALFTKSFAKLKGQS